MDDCHGQVVDAMLKVESWSKLLAHICEQFGAGRLSNRDCASSRNVETVWHSGNLVSILTIVKISEFGWRVCRLTVFPLAEKGALILPQHLGSHDTTAILNGRTARVLLSIIGLLKATWIFVLRYGGLVGWGRSNQIDVLHSRVF